MVKDKKIKPSKELPLGFVDRQEKELLIRDFVISNIKEVMIKYGFQYLETPSFEYTDSIGKFLPDKERPDAGVFSFKDENKWLSLRYDLTAPLARYVAKNYLELPKPFKRYQLGSVWRNEKPGPGRFREFLQFDADYVGTKNLQADAELCVLISEILEKCGLDKKDYTVKVSSRKFTDKLFKQLNIKSKDQVSTTLRALDKIDRLGWGEAKKLLGEGRKDKSGDYTRGAKLKNDQIKIIENALKTKNPDSEDVLEIIKIFQAYNFKNYKFDPSVIRGLEYYTGPIFEVNLNFEVKNSKGQIIQFGSIGGGGRYDNLVSNFGNLDCPATGISIGLDRLVFALMQKKDFKIKSTRPVIICVFDKDKIKEYIDILNKLRASNISSEIYPGESKLKKQMEYANKLGSPAVILYGENNIKFAKSDATDKEIKQACESAAAEDFISNLPEKYKTIIGENGVRLSGGEKQRLSIARAILKNSPIILLDEATSSLDTESEEKVQNAIFNLTKNRTTIVIAHRLSTIKKANRIIVMKDGSIVGEGTHEELLKNSKVYENLYKKQVY